MILVSMESYDKKAMIENFGSKLVESGIIIIIVIFIRFHRRNIKIFTLSYLPCKENNDLQ